MAESALSAEDTRRQVALKALREFANKGGFPLTYREHDAGSEVHFIGTAPDGREFGVGYERAGEQEMACG